MKICELGEFGLIDFIKRFCQFDSRNVIKGIGDDCAVIQSSANNVILITTDTLVEDVHFFKDKIHPGNLGQKAMSVNISDIAAMGGTPENAFVSLSIPSDLDVDYIQSLYEGFKSAADNYNIGIIGGDTTLSPDKIVISITLIGSMPEDEVLYRSGAQTGDKIFITGSLGSSSAGLDIIKNEIDQDKWAKLTMSHLYPVPGIPAGRLIASSKLANSMIDISDGLIADLNHLCTESHLGAEIDFNKIPLDDEIRQFCSEAGKNIEEYVLYGGEDYVLLGSVPLSNESELAEILQIHGLDYAIIGQMTEETGIYLSYSGNDKRKVDPRGYDHFKND
jgi:thiamine-monophosphate kinase